MALLLYCVTNPESNPNIATAVCDCRVESREAFGLRAYWSELSDPQACLRAPEAWKKTALQFREVLREVVGTATPIPFPFPTLLESVEALEQHLAEKHEGYRAILAALGDVVQYELIASWPEEEQSDLATPVPGSEYRKRHQEAAGRVAAVEGKLKGVTAAMVRDWRVRQEKKNYRWFALVPRDAREHFVAALKSAGPSQGVRLRLSGPWPPSEFIGSLRTWFG